MNHSLGPQYRLHYRWEFRKFFGNGEVLRFPECHIYRIANEVGHFRLGITIKAKKTTSIVRNQVKRQIREAFRVAGPMLGNYDYNVVVPASIYLDYGYAQQLGHRLRIDLRPKLSQFQQATGPQFKKTLKTIRLDS